MNTAAIESLQLFIHDGLFIEFLVEECVATRSLPQYINNLETKRSYKKKVNLKNLKCSKKAIERFENYSLIC